MVFLFQIVYPGRILRLRVRGTKRDLKEDTSSEEVCVVLAGVIARFDGSDIQVYTIIVDILLLFILKTSSTKHV